jgi:hypothetical protein
MGKAGRASAGEETFQGKAFRVGQTGRQAGEGPTAEGRHFKVRKEEQTMSLYKRGGVYWYSFMFQGERVQVSTRQGSR